MKLAGWIFALIASCVIGGAAVFAIVGMSVKPQPQGAVCLIVHKEVIVVPLVCAKDKMCAKPIVAQVCDQVEIDAPDQN